MLLIRKHSLKAGSFPIWEFWEALLRLEVVPAEDLTMGRGGESTRECSGFKSLSRNAQMVPS